MHAEIHSLHEMYKNAVYNKDVDLLLSLYDQDFRAFDMWRVWVYDGLGAWRETNERWLTTLGTERVLVEFDDIKIIDGLETVAACATVTYKAVSETNEELRSMQNRLTWVAKMKDGVLKIVHQHTSAPIDSNTMDVILHR